MTPAEIVAYRDGTRARDLAILDSLSLMAHGLPLLARSRQLEELFGVGTAQTWRRLQCVHLLGVLQVSNHHGWWAIARVGHAGDREALNTSLSELAASRGKVYRGRERWQRLRQVLA